AATTRTPSLRWGWRNRGRARAGAPSAQGVRTCVRLREGWRRTNIQVQTIRGNPANIARRGGSPMTRHPERRPNMRRLGILAGIAANVICALGFGPAGAQNYPDPPIKVVGAVGAGGTAGGGAAIIAGQLCGPLRTTFIHASPR